MPEAIALVPELEAIITEARSANDAVPAVAYWRDQWQKQTAAYDAASVLASKLAEALRNLASAAARIVEDDAKPTLVHMRELDRCRAAASQLLDEVGR